MDFNWAKYTHTLVIYELSYSTKIQLDVQCLWNIQYYKIFTQYRSKIKVMCHRRQCRSNAACNDKAARGNSIKLPRLALAKRLKVTDRCSSYLKAATSSLC